MCRVNIESPIRVLNADMFATPSKTFELPQYASELANLLAEAPSLPPSPIRPYKPLSVFLDIEADVGEESDRHSTHSG